MSFTQSTFATVGAQATDTPTVYSYKSPDALSQIKATDYFKDKSLQLEEGDVIIVDASDGGTILQIQADSSTGGDADFITSPQNRRVVNSKSDLPVPVAGVMIGAANTQYFIGANVGVGTDQFDISAGNISVTGSETINTGLTYTGTGDMFIVTNARARISQLSLTAATGQIINFSDDTDSIFRMNDCVVICDKFGIFDSSGTNGSSTRFTNVSPAEITTSGCTITGGWDTWVWEISGARVNGGSMFDFGTATFNAIVLDLIRANLAAGTTLITGAAASANINTGGSAVITRMLTAGDGDTLSGVTTDDVRWIFRNNDDIPDTSPDALLTLTSNATATTIADAGVGVLVAGTWVVDSVSQFTGTTGGKATYIGPRNISAPIDIIAGLKSVTGNFDAFISVAINGVIKIDGVAVAINSTKPAFASVIFQEELSDTDDVNVFVTNKDGTNDIIVESSILRVL